MIPSASMLREKSWFSPKMRAFSWQRICLASCTVQLEHLVLTVIYIENMSKNGFCADNSEMCLIVSAVFSIETCSIWNTSPQILIFTSRYFPKTHMKIHMYNVPAEALQIQSHIQASIGPNQRNVLTESFLRNSTTYWIIENFIYWITGMHDITIEKYFFASLERDTTVKHTNRNEIDQQCCWRIVDISLIGWMFIKETLSMWRSSELKQISNCNDENCNVVFSSTFV